MISIHTPALQLKGRSANYELREIDSGVRSSMPPLTASDYAAARAEGEFLHDWDAATVLRSPRPAQPPGVRVFGEE